MMGNAKSLLFLCTGNYYRSRFAELYFRHLAAHRNIPWHVDSRGLQLDPGNTGPLSRHTIFECERLGISTEPMRHPLAVEENDLAAADLTIAVKETEHRPLIRWKFPEWEERVEYWEVHDLDVATAEVGLAELRVRVEELVNRLV